MWALTSTHTCTVLAATANPADPSEVKVSLPSDLLEAEVAAALVIGAVAGLYPAMRAARLSPTDALRLT